VPLDEALVRMATFGICHGARTVYLGAQYRPLPIVLGHEASGIERVDPP
jgi:Zn-dependent alcohol dehydrogenase